MAIMIPSIDELFDLLLPEETPTVTTQKRHVKPERDKPFTVSMFVEDSGDLPDRGLFKYRIVDENRPDTDEFVSVSTAEEFDEFSTKRRRERLKDNQFYRTPSIELFFEDVTDAQQRREQINDAVNDTAKDYNLLVHQFLTDGDGETITFPKETTGSLSAKKARYQKLDEEIPRLKSDLEALEDRKQTFTSFSDTADTIYQQTQNLNDIITDAIPDTADATADLTGIESGVGTIQRRAIALETEFDQRKDSLITRDTASEVGSGSVAVSNENIFIGSFSEDQIIIPSSKVSTVFGDLADTFTNISDTIVDIRESIQNVGSTLTSVSGIRSTFESNILDNVQQLKNDIDNEVDSIQNDIEELNNKITRKENQRETLLAEIQRVDPSFEG